MKTYHVSGWHAVILGYLPWLVGWVWIITQLVKAIV